MEVILNAYDICQKRDGRHALEHVDFHLVQGELLCIYGTYHSGINVLSDILAGRENPASGNILYLGQKISLTDRPQRYISRISRDSSLVDNLSVAENLFIVSANRPFPIRWGRLLSSADRILARVLPSVRGEQKVSELDSVEKRVIEIVKYALMGSRIILIDNVVYFSENANEILYDTIRLFCERGLSFIYLGQKYDYFTDKADRVLALRNGHMAGELISSGRNGETLRRMISPDDTETLSAGRREGRLQKKILLEYELQTKESLFRGSIQEDEVVCFLSYPAICTRLGEAFRMLVPEDSLTYTEEMADGSWTMRKREACSLDLIPYDNSHELVCPHLSVYENAYLNLGEMDLRSRASVRLSRKGYFAEQIDGFLQKPPGWSVQTDARRLTFQEQRLILLYRSMLARHRAAVLLFPTGDMDRIIRILRNNHMTVILITDSLLHLENLVDTILEIRHRNGRYDIMRKEVQL